MIRYEDLLNVIRKEKQLLCNISNRKKNTNILPFKEKNNENVQEKKSPYTVTKKDETLIQYL